MVKWIALTIALLFTSGCVTANPVLFTKANTWIYFPECHDPLGLKVQWVGVPVETLKKFNARAAVGIRSQTPAFGEYAKVLYNKDSLPYAPDEWIRFILYHECAHHELGHLLPEYKPASIQDEWDADCVAVKKLKEENVPLAKIHLYSRMFLRSKSDTHGDRENRISNMQQCYAGIAQ